MMKDLNPSNSSPYSDILTCLKVDRESKRRARQSSKLWTEVGINLQKRDDWDFIHIDFAIKWEVTAYPELIQPKKTDAMLEVLHSYFPDPNSEYSESLSAQNFYQSAHSPDPDDEISACIETPGLKSTLYPFQKRAIQWLLRREGVEWRGSIKKTELEAKYQLPVSFIAAIDSQGRSCYVSHLFGIVCFDLAPFYAMEQDIKGGILAEEMGLGKTVEIIALVTLHTRSDSDLSIFDPFTGQTLRKTNATLIISPPSISSKCCVKIKC